MGYRKILIANRGEIACRVIRSARKLGYNTVAVYSDADAQAPHVALADEAVALCGLTAAESYLQVAALLDAARRSGADALHPGYGFLSENAAFAQACADAGLVFIGPPAAAIAAMGSKSQAKQRMLQAGVPCVPGYLGAQQDDATLKAEALKLGLPLLVKAVSGGGGRGMRLVRQARELDDALAGARREALSAFGDGTLMLERLVENGRHIEVQVFADSHGNTIHLGERDCTAQRRRQKVIEEAPSPVVSPALRAAMGRDAVAAALAVGYCGAGTVEFIVDADLKHYFLEMNTRLQVEHAVTECITGLDLVQWQLRIADGHPLPLRQDEVRFSGHAIEARLYAEDPYSAFAPQTGPVLHWRPQAALHMGIRIDDGIAEGGEVTPHYDAMVAKVIAHGLDRDDAIRRLRAALAATPLLGLRNNTRFLYDLVDHPAFRQAQMHTALIDQWQASGEALLQAPTASTALWCVAAAALALQAGPAWRADSVAGYSLHLQEGDTRRVVQVRPQPNGEVDVVLEGQQHTVHIHHFEVAARRLRYRLDGVTRQMVALLEGPRLHLVHEAQAYVFNEVSAFPEQQNRSDPRRALAPVAGKVSQVAVAPGDTVKPGQPLLCVEAMKMEMWLHAHTAGTVAAVHVQTGQQVVLHALLVEIEISVAEAEKKV